MKKSSADADFRSKAGFKSYIVRKDHSGCCEWCARQAGKYEYPGVPEDVFGRHDNCTCTLTYHTDGKRQQVWSKREWSDEQEQEYLKELDEKKAEKRKALAERKEISGKSKPKRLTPTEAAERQARVLDKSGESGIIKATKKISASKVDTGGRRNEAPLSPEVIEEIKKYAVELGMPEAQIRYGEHYYTSYGSNFDMLYIGTDVLPSSEPQSINSKLSWKSAIAHELVGHREACLNGWEQKNEIYDEIQASIRAARFAPGLSKSECITLLMDACERARSNGVRIKDIKHILNIDRR